MTGVSFWSFTRPRVGRMCFSTWVRVGGVGGGADGVLDDGQPLLPEELVQGDVLALASRPRLQLERTVVRAAWATFLVANPAWQCCRRSLVSLSPPPQAGQVFLALPSTQCRRPQLWQR